MKNAQKKTKELLTSREDLRDNEKGFIAVMLSEHGLTREQAELIAKYSPKVSTYKRARRRVQQLFPNLRGLNWAKRQKNQEPVKEQLGY